jgi:transaldolase
MKLFLDTANLADIKKYAAWGLVDGITTNPSLIAKEGVSLEKRIKEICAVVKGPVSTEVVSLDSAGMIEEGKKYSKWAKNVYVKCPMTPEGLVATQKLTKMGVRVNVTLVFSANQALLAAKAGAAFVSPFIGRLEDAGLDGMKLVEEIMTIFKNYKFKTKVLVASIRTDRQVEQAAMLGADICTVPSAVYEKLFKSPFTDAGLKAFLEDWKKSKK